MTTFAAKRSPRPLPIIFATLDPTVPRSVLIPQSLADELVSYMQWPLQFSSHSRDEIRDTLFATAVERLLNRDHIWQLSKKPNLLPPAARTSGRAPLIRQRANVADGREANSQPR